MAATPHDFVLVIPVADRPRHLADCLNSLQALRQHHPYAGEVSVLIADDSKSPENIARHRDLAAQFTQVGLPAHHLDQDAQRALVANLTEAQQAGLAGIVGRADAPTFHHKGASITRNIAYLWLNRLQVDGRKRLFWFLDSDQEFRVSIESASGEISYRVLDYFNALDRIFSETPTRILTGKVVGDPPVSPAVMAGTFLDDVAAFLADMARRQTEAPCTFHGPATEKADEAAYHDMADLFGFKPKAAAFRYRCPLSGLHTHGDCLADFGQRLNRFFDGEHPTRRSHFEPDEAFTSLKPARTLYTGNYVFKADALDRFIPFAELKLRMAGPTLGRLIRAELGEAFVSANLPMLHKRTVGDAGTSEFRPGIARQEDRVDLTGEFERQYFGDIMLFSVERLTAQGFPTALSQERDIRDVVETIEAEMYRLYRSKQAETADKIERLAAQISVPAAWWNNHAGLTPALEALHPFIANMRRNFSADSPAWQIIDASGHRDARKAAIVAAILAYPDDRAAWKATLATRQP